MIQLVHLLVCSPFSGSRADTCGQTDRQTYRQKDMTGLIDAFSDYAKAPRNKIWNENLMRNQKFYSNHLVELVIRLYLSIIRRACGTNCERHALYSSFSIAITTLAGRSTTVRSRR
jgi:hypothetical protein